MNRRELYIAILLFIFSACSDTKKIRFTREENKREKSAVSQSELLEAPMLVLTDTNVTPVLTDFYSRAFYRLKSMSDGDESSYTFKKAVYEVENAWNEGNLSYDEFNNSIGTIVNYSFLIKTIIKNNFDYDFPDRDFVLSHYSIFSSLSDSTLIIIDSALYQHIPMRYDKDDFGGQKDWKSTFVSNLLLNRLGNCKSLAYLYKIMADELGIETHLALAPYHVYIKHSCLKTGMYNTELTNHSFPNDAWIMSSGYIHLDAIRNGIYMRALNEQEALSLCLVDLALGYQKKYGELAKREFVLSCVELALDLFEYNINALLLKADVLAEFRLLYPQDSILKKKHEDLVAYIYKLGYRNMPKEMYETWLLNE